MKTTVLPSYDIGKKYLNYYYVLGDFLEEVEGSHEFSLLL